MLCLLSDHQKVLKMPEDTLAQFSDIILIDIMYFVSFMFPQGSVVNALSAVRPSVSLGDARCPHITASALMF